MKKKRICFPFEGNNLGGSHYSTLELIKNLDTKKFETLKKIPFKALSNDYHFDHEMIILFALSKKKIVEIPIPTSYAEESTSPSVSQTIKYSSDVIYDLIKVVLHKCGINKQKKFLLN